MKPVSALRCLPLRESHHIFDMIAVAATASRGASIEHGQRLWLEVTVHEVTPTAEHA